MIETGTTYDRAGKLTRLAITAVVAVALAAAPGVVSAQEAGADEAVQRLQEQYGTDVASSVQELAKRLRGEGLPTGPLWSKALEGASKNVPEGPFMAGMQGYGERLRRAGRALPDPGNPSALMAAADAIQRGVPEDAIRDVAGRASGGGEAAGAIPLVVLGDLVSAGVPVDRARSVVEAALKRGQGPREMLVTSWAVRDLIGKGRGPAAAARQVGRAVGRGQPPTSVPGVGSPPSDLPVGGPPVPPGAGPPPDKGKGKGPPGGGGPPGSGGSGGSGG